MLPGKASRRCGKVLALAVLAVGVAGWRHAWSRSLTATTAGSRLEGPKLSKAIASEVRSSSPTVKWTIGRNRKPKSLAGCVTAAKLSRIIDAPHAIVLDHFFWLDLKCVEPHALSHHQSLNFSRCKWKLQLFIRDLELTINRRRVIDKLITAFCVWNDFRQAGTDKDTSGLRAAHILNEYLRVAGSDRCTLGIAGKRIKELWGTNEYYIWRMVIPIMELGMNGIVYLTPVIDYGRESDKSTTNPLNSSDLGCLLPVTFQRPFLGFIGLTCGFFGMLGVVICVSVGGSWRQFWGSVGLLILGVLLIHVMLFYTWSDSVQECLDFQSVMMSFSRAHMREPISDFRHLLLPSRFLTAPLYGELLYPNYQWLRSRAEKRAGTGR
jgi:hypothetical protein